MEGNSDGNEVQDKFFIEIPSMNASKWDERAIFGSQFHQESSNMCSIVSIKDSQDSSLVFPPINHENLRTPSSVLYNPPFSSSSSSSLSTLSVENDVESNDSTFTSYSSSPDECVTKVAPEWRISRLRGVGLGLWVNLGLEVVYSKIKVGFSSIQSSSTARSPAVVVVMMGFLYIGLRRLLRRRKENRYHLHRVIREKEERIHELLRQIAQMNELLVARKQISTLPS